MPGMSLSLGLTLGSGGGGGASYTLPTPTGLISLGDSRIQLSGGLTGSGTAVIESVGNGHGYAGRLYSDIDNALRAAVGYNFGVTSSTTRAMEYRASSSSIALTGNPANGDTAVIADAYYNRAALGDFSPIGHPSNIIMFMGMINSLGVAWYTSGSPAGDTGGGVNLLGIMKSAARIFDAVGAANKVIFVAETPKGKATIWQETKAVASGTFTATNTTGFVGGAEFSIPVAEVVTAAGAVLTKVASGPVAGQYSVTAGGVYTVDAGLNGTNVYITYSYGAPPVGDNAKLLDLNEWLQSSSPSPFVAPTSGISYAIAGAQYQRGWVKYFDAWGALYDTGLGMAKNGTMGDDGATGLHPGHAGVTLAAAAFRTAFLAAYPSQTTNLRPTPAIGAQEVGNSGGAVRYTSPGGLGGGLAFDTATFNTASPPAASAIRFTYGATAQAGPTIVTATDLGNGFYRLVGASLDTTSNGPDSAPTRNFINTATGAWDLTLTATTGTRLYFERDFSNTVPNALFDYSYGAGTKSGTWTGTAPRNWTIGCADTGLGTTLTVTIAEGVCPDTGKTCLQVDVNGLAGTGGGVTITSSANALLNRMVQGSSIVSGARVRIEPGTNGKLYGIYGAHNRISFTTAGSATRGAYTGVTSYGSDNQVGTINYPLTDMDLVGGAWVSKMLSPPLDISSPMTISAVSFTLPISWQASKPVSFRAYITEAALQAI